MWVDEDIVGKMTNEEIGKMIKLENQKKKSEGEIRESAYEITDTIELAAKTFKDKYRGSDHRLRFVSLTPLEMLSDIRYIEEILKAAKEKIYEYLDVVHEYEVTYKEEYKHK